VWQAGRTHSPLPARAIEIAVAAAAEIAAETGGPVPADTCGPVLVEKADRP
jgi:hypothetical protein